MVAAFTSVKGAWSPRLLNPALWIDARRQDALFQLSAGTTPVTDGSVCGYVKDISGNGFDLSSTVDSSVRPNWVFNNGFSYLDCDSAGTSNTVLRRAAGLGLYAAGACSVFMGVRANPGTLSDVLWSEGNSASSTQAFMLRTDATTISTSNVFVRTDASVTVANATVNTSIFDNTDRVVGFVWDGTTAVGYNNLTPGTGVSLASGSTITLDTFSIGCRFAAGAPSGQFECRIYNLVVVKRAINSTDRIKLTKSLGKAMGLVL